MTNDKVMTQKELYRFTAIMEEEEVDKPWFWYRDDGEVVCMETNGDFVIIRNASTPLKKDGLANVIKLPNARL